MDISNINETRSEKSFLEKFFDRELESTISNDSNDKEKKKNELNGKNLIIHSDHQRDLQNDNNSENFINKLFEGKLITSKSDSMINDNEEKKNVDGLNDKISYLKEYRFKLELDAKNEKYELSEILENYLRIYDMLNSNDSGLFNVYFKRKFKLDCQCLRNAMDCCLLNVYNLTKSNRDKKLDLIVHECCSVCMISFYDLMEKNNTNREDWIEYFKTSPKCIDIDLINDLLSIHTIISKEENRNFFFKFNKNKSKCWCLSDKNRLKCCMSALFDKIIQNNEKSPDFINDYACCKNCGLLKDDLISKNSDENNIFMKKLVLSKKGTHNHTEEEKNSNNVEFTVNSINPLEIQKPRKGIIKNSSDNEKKSVTNKKSVNFINIEDPKYGWLLVPIPDWQENLREPVYSMKYLGLNRKKHETNN